MIAELSIDPIVLDQFVSIGRPFVVCDRAGSIVYADPAARTALSLDCSGRPSVALRDLARGRATIAELEQAVAHVFGQDSLAEHVCAAEGVGQFRLHALRDAGGRPIGVVVELEGACAAPPARDATSGDDEPYRRLIENTSQGIIVHRHNRILFANQAAASVLGYDNPDELCRLKSIDDYVHPDDRVSTQAYRASRGRGEWAPDDYEFRAVRKDGEIAWINCRPTVTVWNGKPAYQVTFFDVTRRKRAEDVLARSDRRFRDLLDQAALGVLICWNGQTVFANQAAANLFGYQDRHEILDVGVVELAESMRNPEFLCVAADDVGSSARYCEFNARRQDGATIWLGCWTQSVTWDDDQATLSFLADITERKRPGGAPAASSAEDAIAEFVSPAG